MIFLIIIGITILLSWFIIIIEGGSDKIFEEFDKWEKSNRDKWIKNNLK